MSYLFAAYSVVWIALFAYVFSLFLRQKRLFKEIESLKQIMEEKSA